MEEDEKVSLLMILKRPVEEGQHVATVKEPHLRKIFRQVMKDPKFRKIRVRQQLNLKV